MKLRLHWMGCWGDGSIGRCAWITGSKIERVSILLPVMKAMDITKVPLTRCIDFDMITALIVMSAFSATSLMTRELDHFR